MMYRLLQSLGISLSLALIAAPGWADADFSHGIDAAPYPWTDRQPDAANDRFTFAVFADLTGGEHDGVFLPDNGGAFDHVTLVTVDGQSVDIANLKLGGILDKTGKLPGRGESLCLQYTDCPSQ